MREVILKCVPLPGLPPPPGGETLLLSRSTTSHLVVAVPKAGITMYASGTTLQRTRIMDGNHEENECLCYVDMISSYEAITYSLHGIVKIFRIDESNEVGLHLVLSQSGLKTNVTAVKAFRFIHDNVLFLLVGDALGLTLYRLESDQISFRELVFLRMDAPVYSLDVAVASGDIFMVGLKTGQILMFHVALKLLVSGVLRIRSSEVHPSPMIFPTLTANTTTITTNIFSTMKHLHSTLNGENKDQIRLYHTAAGVTGINSGRGQRQGNHPHVSWMVENGGDDDCRERSVSHLTSVGVLDKNNINMDPSFDASSTYAIHNHKGVGREGGGGNEVFSHETSEEMSSKSSIASIVTTPTRLLDDDDDEISNIGVREGMSLAMASSTISIPLPLSSDIKPNTEAIAEIEDQDQQKSDTGLSPSVDDVFMPLRDHRGRSMSRQTRSQSLDDVNLQRLSPGQGLAASGNLEKSSPKTPNNLDTVRSRMMSLISSVVPGSKEKEVDIVGVEGHMDAKEKEKESLQTVPSSLDHTFKEVSMEWSISDVPLHGCFPRSMASGPALVAMSPLPPNPTVSSPQSTNNSTFHDDINSSDPPKSISTSGSVSIIGSNREESVYGSFVIAWLDGRLCTGTVTAILEKGLCIRDKSNEGQGKGQGMSTSQERDDDGMVSSSIQPSIQPSKLRRNTITFQWQVHRSICVGEAFCQVQFLPQSVSLSKTTDKRGLDQELSFSSSSSSSSSSSLSSSDAPIISRDLSCCVVSTWTGTLLIVSIDNNQSLKALTSPINQTHHIHQGTTTFEDTLSEPEYVLSFDTRLFLIPHNITIARQFACQSNTLYLFNEVGECFVVSDIHQQLSTTIPHELPTITFKQETIEGIKKLLNIMRYADEKDLANLPDSIRSVLRNAIDRSASAGMGKEGWKERQGKELRYVLNYLNSKA